MTTATAATRIQALREQVMSRGGSFEARMNPCTRDVALWRAMGQGRSRVQVRAELLRQLGELAPTPLFPEWRLAGEHLAPSVGEFGFALAGGREPEGAAALLAELGVTGEDVERVREAVRAWTAPQQMRQATGTMAPDTVLGHGTWTPSPETGTVYWASGWIENHSIRDYARVLREGFGGILRDIGARLQAADIAHPDYPRQESFWRAAMSVCQAGIRLGQRYAEAASRAAAAAGDPEEQARLEGMAAACARVPAQGARTFAEAVQSLWLAHVLTCGEDGINANSIGRLDQVLYPYYQADVEAGRLEREEAVEWMSELACKLYLDYDVQAIVLGGLDRGGRDAANELSYLILEATARVGFVRDVSVRLHRHSPRPFVELACRLACRGGGIPFFFNDECFVPALASHGIALEDARDYAPIGCIELTVPGRANPHAVSGWFNAAKCLELALFDGRDPRSGHQLGPCTGLLTELSSLEEVWAAYRQQVDHFARRMVYHCNRGELAQREGGPLPCWSTLTDDCIARGRDITDGGPLYNYHSICFLGTANVADSLMALERLVFQDRKVGAGELLEALRRDWQGCEPLRQAVLHQAPKYGNGEPEVDALAARAAGHFIDLMDGMRSPLGGRYHVHLFSFHVHLAFGKAVGATPDGRRAGQPLAYSLSAHQGRDESGVTALLNSIARMPQRRAAGASAAIVELDPAVVAGEAGVERLVQLVQGAVEMGVGQMQWNVTTVERLRQAQADPEHYGNIPVRVAGYSQMFRLIPRELQDHIIARTKHTS
ncbi:MAG: pyruvate formate lyase family protein [Candidatus Latescibacterota bacterium]